MSSLRVEIGKKIDYKNLLYTVPDTIYYCIDTNEVFRGDNEIDQVVRIVAAESPSPYQGVLYVIQSTVKIFNGTEYEVLGEAYNIGTSKLYTLEMALEDSRYTSESSTSVQHIEEDTVESALDRLNSYRYNAMNEAEYSSTITQVDDTSDLESISDGALSTFTTLAVANIRTWDNTIEEEIIVNSVEELDTIDINSLHEGTVAIIPDEDISTKYIWNGTEWIMLGQTSSLDSYYEDVDYIAAPLTYNTFSGSTDISTVTTEEEIDAVDYVMFSALSGAPARGVVSSPSTPEVLDEDIATTGYVASVIAASTQNILSYVDGLSQLYDPLGAADEALARAKAYTDQRLRWNRLD